MESLYLGFDCEFSNWEILLMLEFSESLGIGLLVCQFSSDGSGLLVLDISWFAFLALELGGHSFSVLLGDNGKVFGDSLPHNLTC